MASQNAHADVVFMDPPRSGSTEEFMDAVAILNPDRVVYVSCNPETLARDLAYFKKKGYRTEKAWAVDQFPATSHVETVVLLSKGMVDSRKVIAQVKKKCGIETGENHYLPKSEKAKQPHVTPEKEEAIMKAFKHFGVI